MALSQDELNKLKAELKAQADFQAKINEHAGDYLKLIKEIKLLNKDITSAKNKQAEQEAKAAKAASDYEAEVKKGVNANAKLLKELEDIVDLENAKRDILRDEVKEIQKATAALVKQAKEATNMRNVFASIKKDVVSITSNVKQNYGRFKSWSGTFEMDKSIRMSATQMGLLSKQTDGFRGSLDLAASTTASFGVSIGELAKMQADYSDELGRTVMLGKDGLEAMGQMAKATGLGAENAAKMAADMENQGYSAERTRDFVEQTMNDSHKMGLNASKVIKNIQSNMKMLNKYNFKGGVKGLAKMAETATKLGVDMNMVSGMAEKLFDIEGAVDMSAQLQVMGGEWAKMADPFKLMYMARNDMEGLTAAMGKAAEASVHFNKENADFEISALEMHKLRKIAEQTGVAYEDLATAGKHAAKFTAIKKQMRFNMSDEEKDFLATTSKFNDKGEAYIEIDGNPKLLKSLSNADKGLIKSQMKEKASLKERAEASQTFDEKISNIIMQFKQYLLPFVVSLDKNLRPIVQKLTDTISNPKLIDSIKHVAEIAGNAIGMIGKFIGDNPITSLISFGLFESAKWLLNGRMLGMGFNSVANAGGGSGGGGGLGGGFKGIKTGAKMVGGGKVLGGLGTMTKGLGKVAAPLALVGAGVDVITNAMDDNLTLTEKFMKTLDQNKGMATGAALGSVIPGVGTAIGAGIGGIVDMFAPELGEYGKTKGVHDGLFKSPIHDGAIGSDFSKGRGIIQGGKITPIDNKDSLMAMKPNGPVDNAIKGNSNKAMKIEFGEIHFKFDELKVTSPGSPGLSIDLLKDPQFIRNITRMIHVETGKVVNGGVNKG